MSKCDNVSSMTRALRWISAAPPAFPSSPPARNSSGGRVQVLSAFAWRTPSAATSAAGRPSIEGSRPPSAAAEVAGRSEGRWGASTAFSGLGRSGGMLMRIGSAGPSSPVPSSSPWAPSRAKRGAVPLGRLTPGRNAAICRRRSQAGRTRSAIVRFAAMTTPTRNTKKSAIGAPMSPNAPAAIFASAEPRYPPAPSCAAGSPRW